MIPKITGNSKSLNYMLKAGVLLSYRKEINNIKNHLLFGKTEFYNNMVEYNIKDKNRYLLHLLWLFRDIKVSLHLENILDIVESTFKLLDPTVENNQILLAEYLLHFFDIKNITKKKCFRFSAKNHQKSTKKSIFGQKPPKIKKKLSGNDLMCKHVL